MTRTSRRRICGNDRVGAPSRLSGFVKPIAMLLMIIAVSITTIGQGGAELLPEMRAVDAQIAHGLVERADPDKEPFEERIRSLIPQADRNCLKVDQQAKTPAQSSLTVALRQVRKSDVGDWLVEFAAAQGVTICLDRATPLEAHYRSHLRLLGLNAKLGPEGRVVFLAHELAHVPQHPQFSNNRRFSPDDMLLLQRVREAVAEAVATRVLWQLRQQGIDGPWQEKLTTAYRDIAESFAATMGKGESHAQELWATRTAFHHWFNADWRLAIYDDLMLETLARIAVDRIGLIPTSRYLSEPYLRGIADYAGQGFLIGGDIRALIEGFRTDGLPLDSRARLDAILAEAERNPNQMPSSIIGNTLSAVSPQPIMQSKN